MQMEMQQQYNKPYALVTGASRGLGKCFALELAKRKINTILVALPGDNIYEVAEQCRSYGAECVSHETDLLRKENIIELTNRINQNYPVNILINNAGQGATHSFAESELDEIDNLIQLNITATSLITHQLLQNLLKQDKSYILNVSSMASFSPMGYKTVYSASKRYVQHFSRALCQELKNTSVFVSVVHPGPMATNAAVTARIKHHKFFGKFGLLTPQRVAEVSIKQLFRRDSLILIGWANKINWLLMVCVPIWIRLPAITNAVRKEIYPKTKKTQWLKF